MRILCTGAAGYVGSSSLRYLLAEGHEVIAYDNLSNGHRMAVPDDEKRLIVGDVRDRAALKEAMQNHDVEAVMHFAAVASVPDSILDPRSYWDVNVYGTQCVLDAMLDVGVKYMIFSSTAAVYQFASAGLLTEDSPKVPSTPYGATKLACERMIEDYCRAYGMGATCMRYFNAAGASQCGEFGEDRSAESHLIPLIFQVATGRRESVKIFGADWPTRDGTCVRDYVHVDDIAQAHARALRSQLPGVCTSYNIGSSMGVSVREIVTACELAARCELRCEGAPRRAGDPAVLIANSGRLRDTLGWEPRLSSINDIVRTAFLWHSRYPYGYADKGKSKNART